ncbi:pentapeptide repeat-containing protein [Bradyrhizobium sp. URHD0069]|uniref:pentapeptide repeat-containing protein n=1 Tax=Bradyrhizobium sp. URHD0069 TaxID=1380355 RepID=UPI003529CEC9
MECPRTNFSGATLIGCMLINITFSNATFRNAILSSAHVQNCNFFEADRRGANFRRPHAAKLVRLHATYNMFSI